jgi:phage terminase small subunit
MTRKARPAVDLMPRQERFVEEYLVDLNAKQAAIRAGYSPRTAEVQGSRLLSHVKVQRALTARMAARSQRTEVAADRTLLEIARVGFSDLRRIFHEDGRLKHPHEWDDDTAASIASVEVVTRNLGDGMVEYVRKIKLWDKGKALEQLCKHLGLYQNQEISEQPDHRPLTDLTDQELYQRLLDARARLNRAIELEQGIRCQTRLLEGGKPTRREGSVKGAT